MFKITLQRTSFPQILRSKHCITTTRSISESLREFKVVLDESSRTVYVEQPLAEALGWSTETPAENGVPLTLRGWEPNYFIITRSGSEAGQDTPFLYEYSTTHVPHADELARSTINSSRDPQMREVLDYLKEC